MSEPKKTTLKGAANLVVSALVPSLTVSKGKLEDNYDVDYPEIGSGHFSKVHAAHHKRTGKKFAVKFIDKEWFMESKKRIKMLQREIEILRRVSEDVHPNIVHLWDIYDTDDTLYLVMEYMDGGELFDHIVDRGSYSEEDACAIMVQIFGGLRYLHDAGIVHRDLKPENLLVSSNGVVKVADFGLSTILPEDSLAYTSCGTPSYVAPEVIASGLPPGYAFSCDMWSCGVIMYILLCGFAPFQAETHPELFEVIRRGEFDFPDPWWTYISDSAKDLICGLLEVDVVKRLTCEEALAHPWVTSQHSVSPVEGVQNNMKQFNSSRKTKARAAVHATLASVRLVLDAHRRATGGFASAASAAARAGDHATTATSTASTSMDVIGGGGGTAPGSFTESNPVFDDTFQGASYSTNPPEGESSDVIPMEG